MCRRKRKERTSVFAGVEDGAAHTTLAQRRSQASPAHSPPYYGDRSLRSRRQPQLALVLRFGGGAHGGGEAVRGAPERLGNEHSSALSQGAAVAQRGESHAMLQTREKIWTRCIHVRVRVVYYA